MKRIAFSATLLGLLMASSAHAHQKSVSYSKWTLLEQGGIAEVRVRWLELTSLPSFQDGGDAPFVAASILPYLKSRL